MPQGWGKPCGIKISSDDVNRHDLGGDQASNRELLPMSRLIPNYREKQATFADGVQEGEKIALLTASILLEALIGENREAMRRSLKLSEKEFKRQLRAAIARALGSLGDGLVEQLVSEFAR
jgi:hypothetical protein